LIRVNDQLATTGTYIRGGEQIVLTIPKIYERKVESNIPLRVLFEDEHIAVVNKPAGLLTSGNQKRTLANALAHNLQPSELEDAIHPHPAHRLDYETSGIVLVGKSRSSLAILCQLFESKEIFKTYFAVTIGEMPAKGEIRTPVKGQSAISKYKVLQRVDSERFGCLNFVKLEPETGRRNQLREHLKSIGNPILGDKKFGIQELILKGKGLYLHAFAVRFTHPATHMKIEVCSELPKKYYKIFSPEEALLNK